MRHMKMKKTMLITAMATALNMGMGLENGGYAMIKDEVIEKNSDEDSEKITYQFLIKKIENGSLEEKDLLLLHENVVLHNSADKKISELAEIRNEIENCISHINSGHHNCTTVAAKRLLSSLNVIANYKDEQCYVCSNVLHLVTRYINRELFY